MKMHGWALTLAALLTWAPAGCGSGPATLDAARRDADVADSAADAGREDADAGREDASEDAGREDADAGRADAGRGEGGFTDAGTDPDTGAPACGASLDSLDLLFVIDNSHTLDAEQLALETQLPLLMRALTNGEILDGTGAVVRSASAVASLHVGVVDTDMGSGGFLVPTCVESNFGDDGVLNTVGGSMTGCGASYPSFLKFPDPVTDGDALADSTRCLVDGVGAVGCGFEQPLEAMLKAVTARSASSTFAMGTRGHGDLENAGFLRAGSAFGVILLTNEDDCSASDGDLFNQSSSLYVGDLNLRCWQFPEALHPLTRYVDGLLRLRPSHPERLVYAAIVGVPADLVTTPLDYDRILADPRMQQRRDPLMPSRLDDSCTVEALGRAEPPVRLATLARDLQAAGSHASVQSICRTDLSAAMNAILDQLFDALEGRCPR